MSYHHTSFAYGLVQARTLFKNFLQDYGQQCFDGHANSASTTAFESTLYHAIGRIDVLEELDISDAVLKSLMSQADAAKHILKALYSVCLSLEVLNREVRPGEGGNHTALPVSENFKLKLRETLAYFREHFTDYWVRSPAKTITYEELIRFDISECHQPNWRHPRIQALIAMNARSDLEKSIIKGYLDGSRYQDMSDYETSLTNQIYQRLFPSVPNAIADDVIETSFYNTQDISFETVTGSKSEDQIEKILLGVYKAGISFAQQWCAANEANAVKALEYDTRTKGVGDDSQTSSSGGGGS